MIYDCFTFFNELDLLEIRLRELDSVVDRFVLVEATLTHQGKPKPLWYAENKERFAAWHHKLTHVVVDQYPQNQQGNAWVYEKHQRNQIIAGLKELKPDDQVMISDVDEIPRPAKVLEAARLRGVRIFRQRFFYYYLNCMNDTDHGGARYEWNGTVMVRGAELREPLQAYRDFSMLMANHFHPKPLNRLYWRLRIARERLRSGWKPRFVHDGGWHFSYLGGVERIIAKIEAFAHTEFNADAFKQRERIEAAIANGEDIFGRDFRYRFVPLDASFPMAVTSDTARWSHLIGAKRP
ncbi:MAG: hypothetical protein WAT74_10860 [Flavobacteriales bacterium]